jgi:phage/plasmid-associated DNA primase
LQFKVRKDVLYATYTSWCKDNGEKEVLTGREFGSEMTTRGFELKHSNSVHYRHGITLIQSEDSSEPLKKGVF